MPIQINYIDDGLGVEFICSGVVTRMDIIEANREIFSNVIFMKQKYHIIDRNNCSQYRVSNEEIQKIIEQDKAAAKMNPNIAVALISSSELQYGISRVYQSYSGDSGFLIELFRDRKTADEWIGKQLKI